jgi:hypothetical protein
LFAARLTLGFVEHLELERFASIFEQQLVDLVLKLVADDRLATQLQRVRAQLDVRVHQELFDDEKRIGMVAFVHVESNELVLHKQLKHFRCQLNDAKLAQLALVQQTLVVLDQELAQTNEHLVVQLVQVLEFGKKFGANVEQIVLAFVERYALFEYGLEIDDNYAARCVQIEQTMLQMAKVELEFELRAEVELAYQALGRVELIVEQEQVHD